jgi:hypothetical protein
MTKTRTFKYEGGDDAILYRKGESEVVGKAQQCLLTLTQDEIISPLDTSDRRLLSPRDWKGSITLDADHKPIQESGVYGLEFTHPGTGERVRLLVVLRVLVEHIYSIRRAYTQDFTEN